MPKKEDSDKVAAVKSYLYGRLYAIWYAFAQNEEEILSIEDMALVALHMFHLGRNLEQYMNETPPKYFPETSKDVYIFAKVIAKILPDLPYEEILKMLEIKDTENA